MATLLCEYLRKAYAEASGGWTCGVEVEEYNIHFIVGEQRDYSVYPESIEN